MSLFLVQGTKGEPMVPKAGIQSGVEVVQPADEGKQSLIIGGICVSSASPSLIPASPSYASGYACMGLYISKLHTGFLVTATAASASQTC